MEPAESVPRPRIAVVVVASPGPRQIDSVTLDLQAGSRVSDAVQASGLFDRHPGLRALAESGQLQAAVWGRRRALDGEVFDGDRVELCRPLQVDPKEARRLRYRAQGEKGRRSKVGQGEADVSGSRTRSARGPD